MSNIAESSIPAGLREPQEAEQEPQEAEPVPEPTQQCHDDTPKKKKKKKKERIKEEETEEEITRMAPGQLHCLAAAPLNGSTEETNSGDTIEKKKKKRKEKRIKEEEDQLEVFGIQNHSSFGVKPGKKRKLESGTDAPSVDDISPKKSKKKRKSDV